MRRVVFVLGLVCARCTREEVKIRADDAAVVAHVAIPPEPPRAPMPVPKTPVPMSPAFDTVAARATLSAASKAATTACALGDSGSVVVTFEPASGTASAVSVHGPYSAPAKTCVVASFKRLARVPPFEEVAKTVGWSIGP